MRRYLAAALLCTAYAHAQQPKLATSLATAPATGLDSVVVTATRVEQSSFDLPVSIDSLNAEQIRGQQPHVNLSESLARIPGVVAQNRQNYAQDLQISSRGFGARSTFGIRGIRLIADGIPATMPDGQGQAATFDLDTARRIEVLRGPFSAIYGNASGGVIQIFSEDGPKTPTVEAGLLGGSYGATRTNLKFGGQDGGLNYLGSAARFSADGYRGHSAVTRDTGGAKLGWSIDEDTRLTLLANSLRQAETQDPLGLTRAQMLADPRQAGSGSVQFNTRKSISHLQGGLKLERRFGLDDNLTLMGYSGQRKIIQYQAIAASGVVDLDRGFYGLGARWTHRTKINAMPLNFTAGVDYDNQVERRRGFSNNNGVAGSLVRDEDDRVHNIDQYAQLEWLPTERWSVSAGLRHNRVAFDSRDHFLSNSDDSGSAAFEKTNPMAGVLYHLSDAVNLYANAGQSFETPTFAELAYRPDGVVGLNFALKPSVSRSLETGIKAFVTPNTRFNAALFRIRARDEIVTGPTPSPGRNTFMNADLTARDGLELSVDSDLERGFKAYASYTLISARFVNYINFSGANLTGKVIPGVPRSTLYVELSWRPWTGLVTTLDVRRVSAISVNDANSDAAEAYTLANWRIGFEQAGGGWRLQEFLRIDNLFDRAYSGSVIVNASGSSYFEPAQRRGLTAGMNARLTF